MEAEDLENYFLKTVCLENLHVLSEVCVSHCEDHRARYIDLHLIFVYLCSFMLRFIYNESLYLDNPEKGFSQLSHLSPNSVPDLSHNYGCQKIPCLFLLISSWIHQVNIVY